MLFKVSLQLTFPSQYLTLMLDTCTGKDAVQSRNQDQSQNSGNSQTTDYGNRHRAPHLEPCPPPIAIGIIPRTVVAVVINTGRRRLFPAVTTELSTASPRSRQE